MTFSVGQKIECVDDSETLNGMPARVIRGGIYTVNFVRPSGSLSVAEVLGYYRSDRFRPVVERKSDISIFTSMLNPSPEKVMDGIIFDMLSDIYLVTKQWTS
jgi:hypothetical protein